MIQSDWLAIIGVSTIVIVNIINIVIRYASLTASILFTLSILLFLFVFLYY